MTNSSWWRNATDYLKQANEFTQQREGDVALTKVGAALVCGLFAVVEEIAALREAFEKSLVVKEKGKP